jgi:Protein of unknown function (DUF2946)
MVILNDDPARRQVFHSLQLFAASIPSASMGIGRNGARARPWQFWRRLVGTALIYALILQPLLLAIVGVQLANASAIDNLSLSELCQHAADGTPFSPDDQQKHPAGDHCALCFAAAFHLLDAPRPATVQPVRSVAGKVRQSTHPLRLSLFSRYLVARPRGPPLGA